MTEKEKKILEMQAPSTRRALERPPEEDFAWHRREIKNWEAVPGAKTMEERVAARSLNFEEVKVYQKLRYDRGQHLEDNFFKDGDASSVTPPKRNRAVEAFMFVKMKFRDIMKMAGLSDNKLEYVEKDEK